MNRFDVRCFFSLDVVASYTDPEEALDHIDRAGFTRDEDGDTVPVLTLDVVPIHQPLTTLRTNI